MGGQTVHDDKLIRLDTLLIISGLFFHKATSYALQVIIRFLPVENHIEKKTLMDCTFVIEGTIPNIFFSKYLDIK